MSIEINDRLIGIWSVFFDGGDWLAALSKTEEGTINLSYRFRYYKSAQPFDSEDIKNWYSGNTKDKDVEVAIANMRKGFELMKAVQNSDSAWELLKGDMSDDEYMDALRKMQGIHMKTVTKEELEKHG